VLFRQQIDESDRRGIRGNDAFLQFLQGEFRRQLRHVVAGVVGQPYPNRFRRDVGNHALAKGVGLGFRFPNDSPTRPQDPDSFRVPSFCY